MYSTPVAFLIFNRPDLTQLVFETIALIKPRKLLVVADGPRIPEEAEKCQQARDVIKQVDWDCEVLVNFSDINLGCKRRISSGLDWVFEQVEEAVILEDDCLPHPSFFHYCEQLLEKYRDDKRVMCISGNNFQNGLKRTEYSYYFSHYVHVWGWACWRRAWKHYDVEMRNWPECKHSIQFLFDNPRERRYWKHIFDKVYAGKIDTWDYQWLYACLTQHGLCAIPNVNLVSNIGFRPDATHTHNRDILSSELPVVEIGVIEHPPFMMRNREADDFTFQSVFHSGYLKDLDPLEKFKRPVRTLRTAAKRL